MAAEKGRAARKDAAEAAEGVRAKPGQGGSGEPGEGAERPRGQRRRRKLPPRRPDQLPRGNHGLSRDEVATSQRVRILNAMVELSGTKGYHDTSVSQVIARAGVTRKSFYELFEDKEACFIAAYVRELTRLMSLTIEAFETQDQWIDGVRAGLSALLHALAREPPVARMCFIEVMAAGPRSLETRNEQMRGFTILFDSGRLEREREHPAALALNMIGGMSEIIARHVASGRADELPDLLSDLMYTAVLPIYGHEAAERELRRGYKRLAERDAERLAAESDDE
jgi:AcrR family transcriptional regulator